MADAGLWGLFLSSFISSTLFPGGSEVVLGYLAAAHGANLALLLAVASAGNTLGGMSSWGVGWLLARRFPGRALSEKHDVAMARLRRWGPAALLLSWLPVVGDPLCVAAGWLQVRWWVALIPIALGKVARYAVVIGLVRLGVGGVTG